MRAPALILLLATPLSAQWVYPPPSGYPTLNAFLNSLIATQVGNGTPTGNCTQGKDLYLNTATSPATLYYCSATNVWTALSNTGALLSGALASIPSTCTVGASLYQAIDQPAGLQLYACSSANTWARIDYAQGASPPSSCSVGQWFFGTSATAGQNIYLCASANTWTQVAGSGGVTASGTLTSGVPIVGNGTNVITTFAATYESVYFAGNSGQMSQDSGFYYNPSIHQLNLYGSGSNSNVPLNVGSSSNTNVGIYANGGVSGNYYSGLNIYSGGGGGAGDHSYINFSKGASSPQWYMAGVFNGNTQLQIIDAANSYNTYWSLWHSGDLTLGLNPASDPGYHFAVNGQGTNGPGSTALFYDNTATTGVTTVDFIQGANQNATSSNFVRFLNASDTITLGGIDVDGGNFTTDGNAHLLAQNLYGYGYALNSVGSLGWSSSNQAYQTKDIGLSRCSAGLLCVGNGTQGDYSGSLKLTNSTGLGTLDWHAATATSPFANASSAPGSCTVGQYYFNTSNLHTYVCTSANTWTQVDGGGGGSGASYANQLTDITPVRTSSTVATGTFATNGTVIGVPGYSTAYTGTFTITLASGAAATGTTFYIYQNPTSPSSLLVDTTGAFTDVTLSGISAGNASATGYPVDVTPLYRLTAGNSTANQWDSWSSCAPNAITGCIDDRAWLGKTIVKAGTDLTSSVSNGVKTINADNTILTEKFFGTAAPGSVAGNLPGDLFSDTTNHNIYQCNATAGTSAPACTSVSSGGWTQLNGVALPISIGNGGTDTTSFTAYAPILGGTTSTGALQSSVAGTSGQVFVSQGSSTKPIYIDFPERYNVPAANCNNATAGARWSIGSGGTVTCRAGTNNLGGFISITDTSTTFAQFQVSIPADWDTSTRPYVLLAFESATDTTSGHTVIPEVAVSCPTATNGTSTDDVTLSAYQSLTTVTFGGSAVAHGFYTTSVQLGSTQMSGCIAGGFMIVSVGRATDTATGVIGFEYADVTFPRQLVVQAN